MKGDMIHVKGKQLETRPEAPKVGRQMLGNEANGEPTSNAQERDAKGACLERKPEQERNAKNKFLETNEETPRNPIRGTQPGRKPDQTANQPGRQMLGNKYRGSRKPDQRHPTWQTNVSKQTQKQPETRPEAPKLGEKCWETNTEAARGPTNGTRAETDHFF